MAEALAVVSVVSNIVGLVDFASKLYGRLRDTLAGIDEVPKGLRHIKTELPILIKSLEDIKTAFERGKLDADTFKTIEPAVTGCKVSIQELEKLLDGVLPVSNDRRTVKVWKTIKGIVKDGEVNNIVVAIRGYVATLAFYLAASVSPLQPLTDNKLVKIRRWLRAPDPNVNYQKALRERQVNTGQWFLESSLYQDWKKAGSSLWLHGIPGCGKTILSATIVENIQQHTAADPGKALAYFYFDFKDQQKQGLDSLIRSLISQLSQQFISVPTNLDRLYDSHEKPETQPTSDALLAALQPILQGFPQTFIIIDVLDECAQRDNLMKVVEEIFSWKIDSLRVLVTSRREGEIEHTLGKILERQSILSIQTDVVTYDIQLYVSQRLSHDHRLQKWRSDIILRQRIEASLLENAHGMFRWVVCQLDCLGECRNRRQLLEALDNLPPTLDATYDRIFGSIRASDQLYALRILRWLALSARPLRLQRVAEIAAMDPDRSPIFDREEILEDPTDILSICSSLVVVTEEIYDQPGNKRSQQISIVQLAHYSVKEYLISQRIRNSTAASYSLETALCNTLIAKCCLDYILQLENLHNVHERSLRECNMKSYSAKNWAIHARNGLEADSDLTSLCLQLFSTHNKAYDLWHKLYICEQTYVESMRDIDEEIARCLSNEKRAPQLYYASILGLPDVVERMLENGADPNVKGGRLGNPLQAAAYSGHISTVQVLIQQGANINQVGGEFSNALSAALYRGKVDVARLLMDHDADINVQSLLCGPAIHAAISGGVSAARLVLEKDDNINTPTGKYGNALQDCAGGVNTEAAKVLREHGAQINGTQGHKYTALQHASKYGNLDMVKLLLAHGADIYEQNDKCVGAIYEALEEGNIDIAKHIFDHGAAQTINSTDFNFDHTLCEAVRKRRVDIAVFVLEHGANPNAIDGYYPGPLDSAINGGLIDIVRSLIAHGADVNACSPKRGRSPLLSAIGTGDLDLIKFLIDNGADPNGRGELKGTPLLQASAGHVDIVRLLIEHGADASWSHEEAGSALEVACGEGQLETVKLLISRGAKINKGDFETAHPLRSASKYGHLDVAKYLLERGVDTTAKVAAMHEAVSMGNMEIVALLLSNLTILDVPDSHFGEALSRAVRVKKMSPFRLWLEKGGGRSLRGDDLASIGCAVWTWAKPIDMVRFLIEKGVKVNARDDQGSTALIRAIKNMDVDVVKLLIEQGADVNARDEGGTALLQVRTGWWWVGECKLDIAKLLIERGADVNSRDQVHGTVLEVASQKGNLDLVKLLVESGAHVENSGGRFGSALVAASCCFKDNANITEFLLRAGANVDTQHPLHESALSAASRRGHVQIVNTLLERDAEINNRDEAFNDALRAALQGCFQETRGTKERRAAPETKISNMIELLLQKGATFGSESEVVDIMLQAAMHSDLKLLKMVIEKGTTSHMFNDEIFSAILWIASCHGNANMVHFILNNGMHLNSQRYQIGQIERNGQALKAALSLHHFGIASILIREGFNAQFSYSQWKTYLWTASAGGHIVVAKFMVEKDPDPQTAHDSYSDALVAASGGGHYEVVDFLLEKGADANASSKSGTALFAASSRGYYKIVDLLTSKGADVNATSEEFGTALLAASANGHRKIVKFLISKGANIDATHKTFGSAFYVAMCRKDFALLGTLSFRGADINAQGGKYGNALQAALARGYYHNARVLIEQGAHVNAQSGHYGNALQATLSVNSHYWKYTTEERYDMAMFLIENGADINAQGGEFGTALLAAFSNGFYHIAEILIRKGANVNVRAGVNDNAARAALLGAFPGATWKLISQQRTSFAASNTEYRDILECAVEMGNFALAMLLLDGAEDDTLSNDDLDNLLLLAIACKKDALAQALIARGANVDARVQDGPSALQLAVLTLNFFMAKVLVDKKANTNACSAEEGTALHSAVRVSSIEFVNFLLERGADLNIQGGQCGSILQAAIKSDDKDSAGFLVEFLIEKGVDINEEGGEYGNALQAALYLGKAVIAQLLIDKGANVHMLGGTHGNTVQAALHGGCRDLADVLIRQGVEFGTDDGFDDAMETALAKGYDDILDLLIETYKCEEFDPTDYQLAEALQEAVLDGEFTWVRFCTRYILWSGEPNARQRKLNDAVTAALAHGHDDIFDFLVENGANIDLDAVRRFTEV